MIIKESVLIDDEKEKELGKKAIELYPIFEGLTYVEAHHLLMIVDKKILSLRDRVTFSAEELRTHTGN